VSDIETDDESDLGNPSPTANKYKCGQRHNGKKKEPDGPNEWLAKEFDKLHDLYQGDRSKSEFQVRGYQKSSYSTVGLGSPLSCRDIATYDVYDQKRRAST
jgi:DNA polymerase lambda